MRHETLLVVSEAQWRAWAEELLVTPTPPVFLHTCPGPRCAVCRWPRAHGESEAQSQELRSGQGR